MDKRIICIIFIFLIFGINYVNAYNNLGSGVCECNSCQDCTNALNDNSCSNVLLIQDILDYSGKCINDPSNFNNKIFDCKGHTIDGDDSSNDYGIYLYNKSNNLIRNCIITDFYGGIYLAHSTHNTLVNNTANSNSYYGIHLYKYSNDNVVENNTATENGLAGIRLEKSDNNNVSNNYCALNKDYDGIYMTDSSNNKIISNTLTMNDDSGLWILSCSDNYIFNNTITLNGMINNSSSPTGYGMFMRTSINNTIENNIFCDNLNFDIYSDDDSNKNNIKRDNWCDNTSNYADEGKSSGCTYNCPVICTCESCKECNKRLTRNCPIVTLIANITNYDRLGGTCINNPENFNNKIFDCNGNTIDGDDMEMDYGIYLNNKQNNTIRNCIVTDFKYGIYVENSLNFSVVNSTINSNEYGVFFSADSSNITLLSNTMCENLNYDIYAYNNTNGTNNTCGATYNYNDINKSKCTFSCPVNCTCTSCDECKEKLNSYACSIVTLISNITDKFGHCIKDIDNFNNKIFDCNGNTIDGQGAGYGISLNGNTNSTIRNCTITDFANGIYLESSSTISIFNNEILNNSQIGIFSLFSTLILINNSVCNNANFDIYSLNWMSSSGNNNTCNNADGWNDDNKTGCSYCCDGSIPKIYYKDNDGDGYGNLTNNITTCNLTSPSGYVNNSNDCNDNNASIHPGATEICNGVDDNCNGEIDEGVKLTFYRDADNDGYGNTTNTIQACTAPAGYTTDSTDCNDNNDTIHPGATEICNGVDDNCNGEVDEGINCGQDTCSCSNCMECNEKLNNVSCFIVTLTSNILNYSGTCINNPSNFTNKIFDCHRYTIEGNKTKDSYGILLSKKSNSTIRNCIITDFDYGIYLYASLENKIINNTLNSNNYGIYVSSPSSLSCSGYGYVCIHSSYGDYVYSVIEKKFVLISSGEQSSNNEISNNSACENEISDISLNNENENFGNNICDKISNNSNNNLVFCSKNCSSSELQKMLFLYYCDDDGDSYFSKFISGYCFGDDSCIPINCSLDRGNDCNDGNSSIHPGAEEIICNGIDEDCDNFDKCGKRIWSSDKYMHEKNTFYSYEDVYVSGTGFDANREIEIYIIPHKNSINLSDFKIKKNITTDENGNFVSLLWNLPAWNELSVMHYDIIADENLDGIYESGEAIDASPFGFSVDPVWASDENGNPKETFCENEAIYVYGKGLPVKNKNITLYFVPYVKISPGSKFCYRGECINVTHPVKAEIDENGNFRNVVLGWGNAKPGEYNVVPDLNNNGIFDELNNKAMDDSYFTGFGVEKKFDFDNNRVIDIFDAVAALENLSEEKIICNNRCSDVNDNGIDLQDIFYLMERITN